MAVTQVTINELITQIISEQSQSEVKTFQQLQTKLSNQLLQKRKETEKQMQTKISEKSRMESELKDSTQKLNEVKQTLVHAQETCNAAQQELNKAASELENADAILQQQVNRVNSARKKKKKFGLGAIVGGAVLTVATGGAAAPFALGAVAAVNGACSNDVAHKKGCRDAAASHKTSCEAHLANANNHLSNVNNEKEMHTNNMRTLEGKVQGIASSIKAMDDNIKNINLALQKLNNKSLLQARVKQSATNLSDTVHHEAKMKHFANVESIRTSFIELCKRTDDFNRNTTTDQIKLKNNLQTLNCSLENFQRTINSIIG